MVLAEGIPESLISTESLLREAGVCVGGLFPAIKRMKVAGLHSGWLSL